MQPRVAVVGAGFAGLVAASQLKRRGVDVAVYEAAPTIGGLARSFKDEDGFSHDFGAHFITNRLADSLGVADRCRLVERHGEAVFIDGHTRGYPFGLALDPRYAAGAVKARLRRHGGAAATAGEAFRRQYGDTLTDEVIAPLIQGWSGHGVDELSAATVEKIPGGILKTAWLYLVARVTKKAIAIGYSKDHAPSRGEWHVYPEGGLGTIIRSLADEVGDDVHVESPVEAILVDDGRIRGVTTNGVTHEVDAVFSTAPVHVLPKLISGDDSLDYLRAFRYRPMVFVNLRLVGRNLLATATNWFPESDTPFFRVSEATVSMPWLAPEGKTIITVDYGCLVGDDVWSLTEDEIADISLAGLERYIPDIRTRFIGVSVLKTPIAYPIFQIDYEADRRRFERGSGVEGLYSIGRNGEFAHILLGDVYSRTTNHVERFLGSAGVR